MSNWNERTLLFIGEENYKKLEKAHVLVVGLGGVGAYAAEMICRAGVGEIPGFWPRVKYLNKRIQDINNQIFPLVNK